MSDAQPRTRDRPAPAPAHELADVEHNLRAVGAVKAVVVDARPASARLYWDTWEPNEATRSRTLAGVCTAIATSAHWQLVSVHDPLEREQMISNAVTVRRDQEGDHA
jgi:hypothetical protein